MSFHSPKRSFFPMYSSARFMPPTAPVTPSTMRIFRWSRLFWWMDSTGRKGWKGRHWMPSSPRVRSYLAGRVGAEPTPSYMRRTSTPAWALRMRTSRTWDHSSPPATTKYSRKIYRSARSSSSRSTGKKAAPVGKYLVSVFR